MTGPTLTTAWVIEGANGEVRIQKAASASQQLPEDPFLYSKESGESGLVRPLYELEPLVYELEVNTLHAKCVRQKASDIAGRGLILRATTDGDTPAAAEDAWQAFVAEVENDDRGDESFGERVVRAHQDFESMGWAVLEVSRRNDGTLEGMWHLPGHTLRAHADGRRFAQKRGQKTVWFKRFGLDGDVDRERGGWSTTPLDASVRGNELIVIRNYTPRSDRYGLPDHIPAQAAITGWRAQAEFNVRFFDNHAVPSYAVILEGADMSPALEELIKDHFRQIKGDPSRTIVIPIPGGAGDEAAAPKLRFERLSGDVKDASFRNYKQDNALEICIAHGMPPYRVGWPIVGSLGGSTAVEMTQIYNDAIVQPRQETWEQRLNRALLGPKGLNLAGAQLKLNALDTRDLIRDLQATRQLWEMGAITSAAIARFYNQDPRTDPAGDLYRDQLGAAAAPLTSPLDPALAKRWAMEVQELADIRKRVETVIRKAA